MTTYNALCGIKRQSQGELQRHQSKCLECAHAALRELSDACAADIFTDAEECKVKVQRVFNAQNVANEIIGEDK